VLYAKTHGFHWNVAGPMFNTLHLMFMEQYIELWTALDEIAERIRALGYRAPFGGSTYRDLSTIPESNGVPPSMAMVRELVLDRHLLADGTPQQVRQALGDLRLGHQCGG